MNKLLEIAIQAAIDAGSKIMNVYDTSDFGVELKADNSPLTLADKAAHNIIEQYLIKTEIPVLSEEGTHDSFETRKLWNKMWVVDPLDGTKEFVKRTGEFTVNIALIEDGYPVLGVVFVPALGDLYYGEVNNGASKVKIPKDWREISFQSKWLSDSIQLPVSSDKDKLVIVASVSHLSEETKVFAERLKEKYGDTEFLSFGSSLKICKVAEGSADVYPRLGPTMEWDTAAGQAIAELAGIHFINWDDQERFVYNKENLLNSWFVVFNSRVPKSEMLNLIQAF